VEKISAFGRANQGY